MNEKVPNLFLENVEVLPGSWRNFAGNKGRYNKDGNRNFNVVLSEDTAMDYEIIETVGERPKKRYQRVTVQDLIRDGWNVRLMKARDEDDPEEAPRYKLNIAVSFPNAELKARGIKPPKVLLYSGKRETPLNEETVETLDWANYRTADITVRPRLWTDDDGSRKVKAYLREMRVTVEPDRWDKKYEHYGEDEEDGADLPF